jgi:hypothetical protein
MGFVGSILSGGGGAGFQAQGANLQNPVTNAQATGAYDTAQGQLKNIDPFIQALQAQNGIGNQSSVFNQGQQLANQLSQQAQGQGPNPALAQLANSTGQNVGQQAALMAGQRGSGANVGLIARQAGQQGAGIQQNAAGQAAVLRAQQQLAAQGALQQQQGMLGNLASQQVGQQANAINMGNNAAQNEQQILLNGINNQNNSAVNNASQMNSANASVAKENAGMQGKFLGGLGGGLGAAALTAFTGGAAAPLIGAAQSLPAFESLGGGGMKFSNTVAAAHGGMIPHMVEGGYVPAPTPTPTPPVNGLGSAEASMRKAFHFANGGQVGPSSFAGQFLNKAPMDYRSGGMLPGRAVVQGDSPKNDTVPIMGSPGEIMLPRHITQGEDAPEKAKQFVAALLAKQKRKK